MYLYVEKNKTLLPKAGLFAVEFAVTCSSCSNCFSIAFFCSFIFLIIALASSKTSRAELPIVCNSNSCCRNTFVKSAIAEFVCSKNIGVWTSLSPATYPFIKVDMIFNAGVATASKAEVLLLASCLSSSISEIRTCNSSSSSK